MPVFSDTYTEQLRQLIDAKAAGKEVTPSDTEAAPSKVLDLMAALEASLGAARSKAGKKDLPAALVEAAEQLSDEHDDDSAKGTKTKSGSAHPAAKKQPAKRSSSAAKKSPRKKAPARKAAGRKSA